MKMASRYRPTGMTEAEGDDLHNCYLPRFDRKNTHATARPITHVIDVPMTMFW